MFRALNEQRAVHVGGGLGIGAGGGGVLFMKNMSLKLYVFLRVGEEL